ncbi:MAG: T9SS C-terminal target domain-containing protein [Bacteroidetes bacterium]|nr:MAG: T9SS C-terminal target domain-containing protein [Bacteroidota bacterium]
MRHRLLYLGLLLSLVVPARAQDSLDVLFRYVPEPGRTFVRAYLPGEFNGWGPNSSGRIAVDAPSRMTWVDSLDAWVYPLRLRVGQTYQYKVHFHYNASGSEWEWISDPYNPRTNPDDNNNSLVTVADPMVFQLARHEDASGQVTAVSAGVFTDSPVVDLTVEVNGVSHDGRAYRDPDTGVLFYRLPSPVPAGSQVRVAVQTTQGMAEAEVGLIPPAVTDAPRPPGIVDGINLDPADPTTVTFSLFAPGKRYVYVLGDFNDWTVDEAYLMRRDSIRADSIHWWLTVDGLTPGREYAFQYLVDGQIRIADPYSEKVLDPVHDAFISASTYPNLKPYPPGQQHIVGVFETGRTPYDWEVPDFERPPQHELVIYELLLRDFLAAHDYATLIDTLDYLDRLGVNAIELMPVAEFDGNDSWGYNPAFYFAPDKYYGPADDLRRFVDEAHKRGIAVILDVVYNHATGQSPLIRLWNQGDFGAPTVENVYANTTARHPFNVFYDLNHESTALRYLIDRVNAYWVTEFNVDGFRFDLSKGFTQRDSGNDVALWSSYDPGRIRTLKRMADALWRVDPSVYIILEHFGEQREEKELSEYGVGGIYPGMMLWQNMNRPYSEAAMGYITSSAFGSDLSGVYYRNTGFTVPNRIAYMESHDEQWLMYRNIAFGNRQGAYSVRELPVALDRQKLVGAFFFTVPGPKMLWQFGELGYGWGDEGEQCLREGDGLGECQRPDTPSRIGRKPIRWDYRTDPLRIKLYKTWAALLNLRRRYEVFRSPDTDVQMRVGNGQVHRWIKLTHPSMNVYIVGNFGMTTIDVPTDFQSPGTWYEYFTGTTRTAEQDDLITLQPGEFRLYTNQDIGTAEPGLITVDAEARPGADLPADFTLAPNYPNPFNPSTTIHYTLPQAGPVRLEVYDALGRRVAMLVDEVQQPGAYTVPFEAARLPSGPYLYRLTAGGRTLTRTMLLVK